MQLFQFLIFVLFNISLCQYCASQNFMHHKIDHFSQQDFEYFDYIAEHKKNLMIAYNAVIEAALSVHQECQIEEIEKLKDIILIHDLSKFGVDEFQGYRQYFYPENSSEKDQAKWDPAKNHHLTTNPHHPEFWLAKETKMPKIYMLEMICDWYAMGVKFGGKPKDYYKKIKGKLELEFGKTLDYNFIEKILDLIK